MVKHRFNFLVVLLSLVCLHAFSVEAIEPVEVLRVGTPGDYFPYASMNPETGRPQGYDVDLIDAFSHDKHYSVKFVPTTWSKLVSDLQADKFDIAIGGINFTKDRANASLPTQDYSTTWKTVLTRCSNKSALSLEDDTALADLNRPQTQIIVNQGGTNERYVRQYLPRTKRRVIIGNDATLKALLSPLSPPDLIMVTDAEEALVQHKTHPSLCSNLVQLPNSLSDKVFLVNPKRQDLKDAYDAWHETYLESEAFITDRARWFYWFESP